jgi:hypothetical protein
LARFEDYLFFGGEVVEAEDVAYLVEGGMEGGVADFDVDEGLVVDEVGVIYEEYAALTCDVVEDVAQGFVAAGYGDGFAVAVCLPVDGCG